jgi:regulator of protease activity HflC (stomatin/prohibitin superfamily)
MTLASQIARPLRLTLINNPQTVRTLTTYSSRRRLPSNTIVKFVPQQEQWIVERFGKFSRILNPGLNILIPLIEKIRYLQSLKEIAVEIPSQSAVTNDNVTLHLDGVLFVKVVDSYKASYGVEDAQFAVSQLAQTTMRSEIGKMLLDQTFKERNHLNQAIVEAMNLALSDWGIRCLRYEIRDIILPDEIVKAMQMQASAERRKRAQILDSEGSRQSEVNIAEGKKQSTVLASEARMIEQVNHANGEADAIRAKAKATADGIKLVAESIRNNGGGEAVALSVAEKYIEAFEKLAKEGNTLLLPANAADPSSMIAQALAIYKGVNKVTTGKDLAEKWSHQPN